MMGDFPRTTVGGRSTSRMLIGSNWFLGFSHCTAAKDAFLHEHFADHRRIADIIEVFFRAGVDTLIANISHDLFYHAVLEAQERTGVEAIVISTPGLPTTKRTALDGFDMDAVKPILDLEAERGAAFCMPHTSTTDLMVDKCSREVRQMAEVCAAIRERGMIPGLSTHLPETIIYADETGLDVATYVCIYNLMGFLMPLEVDWTQHIIHAAQKPVLTIKPLAAGQVRPLQGLTFAWNTLRDQDMVAVGCMTPREAAEVIELSLDILSHRTSQLELQVTRSKATVMA